MTLIVNHLCVSQSDRIVFLCEELGIPYELRLHHRAPAFSPQSIKDLHPLGAAPIIQDGDVVLAETAAIAEYIIYKHGNGRLSLAPSDKDYATYLYWFHFANGTLQPGMSRVFAIQLAGVDANQPGYERPKAKLDSYFKHLDNHLKDNTWLVGDTFTAADVMTIFTVTTMRTFFAYDLSAFPHVLAWAKRVTDRPAYQRYHQKADPHLPIMVGGPPPTGFGELPTEAKYPKL